MELQISCGFRSQIQAECVFWGEEGRDWQDPPHALRLEGDKHPGSGNMSRPRPHATRNTAQRERVEFHRILKGEKLPDAVRKVSRLAG